MSSDTAATPALLEYAQTLDEAFEMAVKEK